MSNPVFHAGKIHVLSEKCETCIFRPGNLMNLEPGRVKEMVQCADDGGVIPCHKTIYDQSPQESVCRGFFDGYADRVAGLRIGRSAGMLKFTDVSGNEVTDGEAGA